jgi:hypothetical protein
VKQKLRRVTPFNFVENFTLFFSGAITQTNVLRLSHLFPSNSYINTLLSRNVNNFFFCMKPLD